MLPVEPLPAHTRVEQWVVDGQVLLTRNDPCKIKGEGAKTHWRFTSHVTSPTGVEYIEVIGGERGCELTRSFRPDRVSPIPQKGTRKRRVPAKAEAS